MGSTKKKNTETTQNQTATTTLPAWMTAAGEQNYNAAQAYMGSGDFNWSADKAAAYANPYQQQVQDRTVARMGQQNQVEHQALNDTAGAAKAYGGTRHAVLEAAQGRDQNNNILDFLARSNAAGYETARGEFNQDRAAKMGGYTGIAQILSSTPRNTTTTGSANGTSNTTEKGSWIDTVMGLGQIAASAGAFSDPRLKTGIKLIKRMANGLGVYRFRYIWDRSSDNLRTGVMAHEVAALEPAALGPVIGGYLTVNYDKLGEWA